jgi:outer membrane receptor protein involved in Fe transport
MKRILILLVLITSLFIVKAGTGTISGKIIDAKNSETLIGATVIIEGTTTGAASDIEGNFVLKNLEEKTYTLVIRYVGYEEKKEANIIVKNGEVTNVTILMNSIENTLGPVTVTAKVSKDNTSAIITMQKNSSTISSGISGEEIKRSPDRNSSEVIKRVSGATIQDNKYAIIRGLSDRYNYAMVNGAVLPSTEPDRKTFSFDIFPSNLLDNIIITKTAQADLPAEFAGGIIQLNTRDVPEQSFFNFTIAQNFIENSSFKPYYSYKGSKTDFLGVDRNFRALPSSFPSADTVVAGSRDQRFAYAKTLKNDWGLQKKKMAYPGQSFQLSGGYTKEFKKLKFGAVASFSYSNTIRIVEQERYDFLDDGTPLFAFTDQVYSNPVSIGSLLNLSAIINNNHKLFFKNTFNINSNDVTTLRTGKNFDALRDFQKNSMEFFSTMLYNGQLGGEHVFGERKIKLKWMGGYSYVNRDQPNTRRMSYSKDYNDATDTTYTADIANQVNIGLGGMFFSQLKENIYNGGADLTVPFKIQEQKQSIKAGVYIQEKRRDFEARVLGYTIARSSRFDRSLLDLPQDQIFDTSNINQSGFNIAEITNKSDKYKASSSLYAGYLMAESNIKNKLKLVYGVRLEYFRQKLNSFNYSGDSVNIDRKELSILPSINAIYSLSEKSNLRLSYSMTVARPEFREISPFSFYDFATTFTVVGFDSIKQTSIHNVDLRYEYFFGKGQMIAGTVYYKYFKNPIEQIVTAKAGDYTIFSYDNAPLAHNVGAEIEFRKNLDFLNNLKNWGHWDDFTFSANFAYIYSRIDLTGSNTAGALKRSLQGQSPYVLNLGFTYRQPKLDLSFTVLYNQIGKRLSVVGTSVYADLMENSRPLLDLQISKKVFKNGVVKFTMSDLIAKPSYLYQNNDGKQKFDKNRDTIINKNMNYRSYNISFTYTFKK